MRFRMLYRMGAAALCVLWIASADRAMAQTQTPKKTAKRPARKSIPEPLVEQIYRLIWPMGKFDGDLAKAVTKSTQRGGVPQIVRLYLVRTDASDTRVSEWRSARG